MDEAVPSAGGGEIEPVGVLRQKVARGRLGADRYGTAEPGQGDPDPRDLMKSDLPP